ncbi:MAG: 2-oxoacid:acceptor oxidoreductase family protein, partial [Synergistaceae bacterium]|nr:2-oxoacid:acceptor oxidoreductase family protein [Synergistaceae bacterium]
MSGRPFNIYISGVGGQGIGLLAESLLGATTAAGVRAMGVDTHGLAQRGGLVESYLRIGDVRSPLFGRGLADLAICLELTEAVRAADLWVRKGGTVVCYDTVWQSLPARMGDEAAADGEKLSEACARMEVKCHVVRRELPDVRMQNVALLGKIAAEKLIPGLEREHY